MKEISLKISDIDCAACVDKLNKIICSIPGVDEAAVNYAAGRARIVYDSSVTKIKEIAGYIVKSGYGVPADTVEINFSYIDDEIKAKVSAIICGIEEVRSIEFDEAVHAAYVDLWSVYYDSASLVSLLRENGVYATVGEITSADETYAFRKRVLLIRLMAVGLFCTIPLIWDIHHTAQFILALIVQVVCGLYFYKSAVKSVKSKAMTMDILIAVSTTTIFLYSSYEAFFVPVEKKLYFMSGTALITLLLFGKYLELIAMNESNNAVRKLMRLQSKNAVVLRDGCEKEIPIDEIDEHDIIIVRAGDRVPVDGLVLEGHLSVDESMLSGESIPVEKYEGSSVTGGTLCRDGSAQISATALGKDSVLANIIAMVQRSQISKAPVQRIADRIASFFVPAVLIIGVVVFCLWYFIFDVHDAGHALYCVCSLLVIACPCALGLATPTAIMVISGRAAQLGILFRGGTEIENMHKINTVVFDKTGTLTYGKMEVTDTMFFGSCDSSEIIITAASVERLSTHPISSAITSYASYMYPGALPPAVADFKNYPGMGISAVCNGANVLIGSREFMAKNMISISSLEEYTGCSTEVLIAIGGTVRGAMYVSDRIRNDASKTVSELKAMGIDVFMITGDNRNIAADVAGKCGIDNYYYDIAPDKKADFISSLKSEGKFVAMVGDGINDAPSLASADISVAMGNGTDIAIDCSSVVLLGDKISSTVTAIRLSKAALKTIHINLLWAAFYNAVCIPAAMFGVVNPAMAAAAMSLSSNGVLLNSLSLQKAGGK